MLRSSPLSTVVERLFALALGCLLLGGCSTYADQSARLRAAALDGDRARALTILSEDSDDDPDLLALLQRGLLHYEDGDFAGAIADFARAETALDESYTKSISKEALSFLTNDATRDYVPYPSEQVLLNVYAGLSYLGIGDRQGALVELRKVALRLQQLESLRVDTEGYHDDPFLQWLSAMLFADDDDGNAALVACRRALTAFQTESRIWPRPVPNAFLIDYLRFARRFGFGDEAQELLERYPDLRMPLPAGDTGEVILIFGCGFVDHLEELRTDFPILESDDPKQNDDYARRVWVRGRRGTYHPRRDVKIDYWLSVAIPVLANTPTHERRARLSSGEFSEDTTEAADLSAVFGLTFDEGEGSRMVRTIARALAKYLAVQAVKKDKDGKDHEVAGFFANLVASATERADTRSWSLLPGELQMARLRLPTGDHAMTVDILDDAGHVVRTADYPSVRVVRGEHTVLYQRAYR